jgi:thioredoxin 1
VFLLVYKRLALDNNKTSLTLEPLKHFIRKSYKPVTFQSNSVHYQEKVHINFVFNSGNSMKNVGVSIVMTGVCLLILFSSALAQERQVASLNPETNPQVTFVELGSKSCIPCRLMQPVMRAVESRFGPQVKVIFYDVSSSAQRRYATLYSIRLIPTQVFLNKTGKEFFRHEGFYSEAEITRLLKSQGLKPLEKK